MTYEDALAELGSINQKRGFPISMCEALGAVGKHNVDQENRIKELESAIEFAMERRASLPLIVIEKFNALRKNGGEG